MAVIKSITKYAFENRIALLKTSLFTLSPLPKRLNLYIIRFPIHQRFHYTLSHPLISKYAEVTLINVIACENQVFTGWKGF